MVAPNPDRCKPPVTAPRAAIASAYDLGVTSACWGATAGIVQCRETLVSASFGPECPAARNMDPRSASNPDPSIA